MIGTLATVLLLVSIQDAPKDYRLPVMPMWQFGEWLGKESGRDVVVLPEVQDRLVYVNVKQRTLKEVLGFVKEAVGVETLDRNDVLTLRPATDLGGGNRITEVGAQKTLNSFRMTYGSEEELRQAIVEGSSIRKRIEAGDFGDYAGDMESQKRIEDFNPTHVALNQLARAIGAGKIAQMKRGERIVFSTHPTALQSPWPTLTSRFIGDLNTAMILRNRLVLEIDQKPVSGFDLLNSVVGDSAHPVARALGDIWKAEFGIEINLRLFDAAGTRISNISRVIPFDDLAVDIGSESVFDGLTKNYRLTEQDQIEWRRLRLMERPVSGISEYQREDVEWLAQFDSVEPLSGFVSRLFDFAAQESGDEIVTEVCGPKIYEDTLTELSARDALRAVFHQSISSPAKRVRNGLYLGSPLDKWARAEIVPRRALAFVAKRSLTNSDFTLNDLADGALLVPDRRQISLYVGSALRLLGLSDGHVDATGSDLRDLMLMVYARLSERGRAEVFRSEGVLLNVDGENADIRKAFWETLIGFATLGDPSLLDETLGTVLGRPVTDWDREPTVLLAMSATRPVRIWLSGEDVDGLIVGERSGGVGAGGQFIRRFQTVEEFGQDIVRNERLVRQYGVSRPQVVGVRASNRKTIRMQILCGVLSSDPVSLSMLRTPVLDLGSIDTLPTKMKTKLDQVIERARQEGSLK
jgi:hypothetical protein